MSFRKRNVGLSSASRGTSVSAHPTKLQLSGIRPSPVDGRPTTSTGVSSLDALLAGHGGLVLGNSILIEETGATDYAGVLLRFYAAEGVVQGHQLHVVGLPEQWSRELPGTTSETKREGDSKQGGEKMKIAWRYESLGQFGGGQNARERSAPSETVPTSQPDQGPTVFCHKFDLSKRLIHPTSSQVSFLQLDPNPARSPFASVLTKLAATIADSPPETVHRLVVPSLLFPALYPAHTSEPKYILSFLHGLRALLAQHSNRLTALLTLPLSLYPRASGLVRWIELLNDGVIELTPFPHFTNTEPIVRQDATGVPEEAPQGLLNIHRLPVFHEQGSGNGTLVDDWTFTLSRRKLVIKPYNLPPVEGDTEAQQNAQPEAKSKADLQF